ncbi:spore germination protein [Bacillus sp. ISL-35]|uniref:spore germination protein n=1 Tax=Bacillus sp. ISL-35 TaxID=2819122 RepID=UPI001BEBD5D5|nr:spore germination protein [Bacillus sp. ISL-35]MBT2678972.1 spore germination protein [Bacillus sp. ISL-35]MBT2703969.1 spore germination protein [Chryseobacterium sp. ISL-80]
MPVTINLFYFKVNSVSGNGSITIGSAIHNSHTANDKSQGMNSSFGDASPTEALMDNVYIDPDVNDQAAIATADSTYQGVPLAPVPVDEPII